MKNKLMGFNSCDDARSLKLFLCLYSGWTPLSAGLFRAHEEEATEMREEGSVLNCIDVLLPRRDMSN